MSTSDQQGNTPLTRKQLREIRLTGATPVISAEEAAAAAVEAPTAPAKAKPKSKPKAKAKAKPSPAKSEPAEPESAKPAPVKAAPAKPVEVAPAPKPDADVDLASAPLTRRQAREQERIRTASVPVITPAESAEAAAEDEASAQPELVSGVPTFAPSGDDSSAPIDGAESVDTADEDADLLEDDLLEEETVDIAPVSAAAASDSVGEVPLETERAADAEAADSEAEKDETNAAASDDLPVADTEDTGENHVVSPTFGNGLLGEAAEVPAFAPSFDELITADSGGSQNLASNTLIFTPSAGEGSLSGPVASTGEILVTGSYELPRGIGSQGHAHGAADGKEADSVLLDGELHPSSSPTPIAASSAISTIKPAGEVIRPPAPEKGNKLMLTLAITAGGLALALAVALIVAFTTNIFS